MPDSKTPSAFSHSSDFEAFRQYLQREKGTEDKNFFATVKSPSGAEEKVKVYKNGDDSYCTGFLPKEPGVHTTVILHNEEHVTGSPYQLSVSNPYHGGAAELKLWGPGLEVVNVNQPATFDIWTSKAGPGALSISVKGPSKPDIDFKDRKDGLCGASYLVTEPGEYEVSVLFNETHAPGSPFYVEATGKGTGPTFPRVQLLRGQSDASKVLTSGPGLVAAKVDEETSFTVDCSDAGSNMLVVGVIGPTKPCEEVSVKHDGERRYTVTYRPKETGEFTLIVKWGEESVPNSPYIVKVQ